MAVSRTGLALARVRREDGAPQLDLCLHRPLLRPDEAAPALAEMVREHQLRNQPTVLVLEPGEFNLLLVDAPEVDPTELKAAVRWRIRDMLDFHVDDAVVDVFDLPPQRGRARMMYVVAARTALVQRRIALAESAGLRLEAIDIPELAQRNVAALLPEDAEGVALLSLGPDTGVITLTERGTLCLARTLETGLGDLQGDAAAVDIPAVAVGGPGLDAVLQGEDLSGGPPALDAMVLEVQRSLDYYESHFSRPPVGHLLLSGQGEMPPAMVDALAPRLGARVRELRLAGVLPGADAHSPALLGLCLPAIGAALRAESKAL